MPRYLLVRWILAVLAGVTLTSQAGAQCGPSDPCQQPNFCGMPIKVDCKFQFNVKFGQSALNQTNKAPWYTYFPAGAGMDNMNQGQQLGGGQGARGTGQGTRFPGWPAPPCDPPCNLPPFSQANFPNWPSARPDAQPRQSSQFTLTSNSSSGPSYAWQPTTYYNPYPQYPVSQMPPYWYGR